MKNKGCLPMRSLTLKVKWSENCPEKGQILAVFDHWGHALEKVSILLKKTHNVRETTSFKPFCVKNGFGA